MVRAVSSLVDCGDIQNIPLCLLECQLMPCRQYVCMVLAFFGSKMFHWKRQHPFVCVRVFAQTAFILVISSISHTFIIAVWRGQIPVQRKEHTKKTNFYEITYSFSIMHIFVSAFNLICILECFEWRPRRHENGFYLWCHQPRKKRNENNDYSNKYFICFAK